MIRRAERRDAPALPEIERSAGERFRGHPVLNWVADDIVISAEDAAFAVRTGAAWVAENDDRIVGFLIAQPMGDALHVWQVAVHLEEQGRGFGRALMVAAQDAARDAGMAAVTLTTFRDVPWNQGFYTKLGYSVVDPARFDARLRTITMREAEHGLPSDRRCAMRLAL